MICFDAHVHIHTTFSFDGMLDSAVRNFLRLVPGCDGGSRGVFSLLLTEVEGSDFFSGLKEKVDSSSHNAGRWHIAGTQEAESLRVTRDDLTSRLFILAGRQVVSAEKIEVLALATPAKIANGLSLEETVESVRRHGGLAVLPWGVGKWLGKRGEILNGFVQRAAPDGLFVGDNGGRPLVWPAPRLFATAAARGIRLLPGSDPLPLPAEESRVGSYGGWLQGEVTDERPAADLRRLLTDRSRPIAPFGGRLGVMRFLQTQVALRRLSRCQKQHGQVIP